MNYSYILKIGGSILVPHHAPSSTYAKQLKQFIENRIKQGETFVLIIGGGKVCREYQEALYESRGFDAHGGDMIGIASCNFNAEFVRLLFKEYTPPKVFRSPQEAQVFQEQDTTRYPIIVCGALEPGHSSNYDAVEFAHYFGSSKIVNLSNIDYVYDKDPREHTDAKSYSALTWNDYFSCIADTWEKPGMSTPFDPVSARHAKKLGISVIFMKGEPFEYLETYIDSGEYKGTYIGDDCETCLVYGSE